MAAVFGQIQCRLQRDRIDRQVGEDDRDVVGRVARQPKAGGLVASVVFIEHDVETGQTLVDVFGSVGLAVIVVPQGAQRLAHIAIGRARVGEAGPLHVVVIIVKLARKEESALGAWVLGQRAVRRVAGAAIAVRRAVEVVQVGADRVLAKTATGRAGGQVVKAAHQNSGVGAGLVAAHDGGHWRHRLVGAQVGTSHIRAPEVHL